MANKIYTKHTIDEYFKKYGNMHLNTVNKLDGDNNPTLLDNRSWWLINDTYYEVPNGKGIKGFWNNLGIGGKIAICVLSGAVVVSAAAVPTSIVLTQKKIDKHLNFDDKSSFSEIDDLTEQEKSTIKQSIKVETSSNSDGDYVAKLIVGNNIKEKYIVDDVLEVKIGNASLNKDDYKVSVFNGDIVVTIKADVKNKLNGEAIITPKLIKKENSLTPTRIAESFSNTIFNTLNNLNNFYMKLAVNNLDVDFVMNQECVSTTKQQTKYFDESFDMKLKLGASVDKKIISLLETEQNSSESHNLKHKSKSTINDIYIDGGFNYSKKYEDSTTKSLKFNTFYGDQDHPINIEKIEKYVNRKDKYRQYVDFANSSAAEGLCELAAAITEQEGYTTNIKALLLLIAAGISGDYKQTSFYTSPTNIFDTYVDGVSNYINNLRIKELPSSMGEIKAYLESFITLQIEKNINKFKFNINGDTYSFHIELDYSEINKMIEIFKLSKILKFSSGSANIDIVTDSNKRISSIALNGDALKTDEMKYSETKAYKHTYTSKINSLNLNLNLDLDFDSIDKGLSKEIDEKTFLGDWQDVEIEQ